MNSFVFGHGKSLVSYNPDSGVFRWVIAYRKPRLTGFVATREMPNGYLYIKMGGKSFSASRLAYTLAVKALPEDREIDHINRDKTDNRVRNLRVVTRAENLSNRKFKPNRCGATGVSLHKKSGLYRARYKNQVRYYETLEEAAAGYADLARQNVSFE